MRIDRLPKWAQQHIARLESKVEHRDKRIKEMTGEEPSNVSFNPWGAFEETRFLPHESRVRFHVGDNHCDVHVEDDEVLVYGNDLITVSPRSGNVVSIKVRR